MRRNPLTTKLQEAAAETTVGKLSKKMNFLENEEDTDEDENCPLYLVKSSRHALPLQVKVKIDLESCYHRA